jgi:hypothetical protein
MNPLLALIPNKNQGLKIQASDSLDSPVETEDRKSTGVDGKTHSKPTTVLASASVINAIDHRPSNAEDR